MKPQKKSIVPLEVIAKKIYLIRNEKVMLDSDLAELYGLETKVLIQAVKRNHERFPSDFMFQLKPEEFENLKSQIVTSSWGGRRTLPYVFTEHGALMLSSVLRNKRAVDISIAIVQTFIRMRDMLATHKDLARKIEQHDKQIGNLYAYVEQILYPASGEGNSIGFIWKKQQIK